MKGKTVTVSISAEQYEGFMKAIEANRRVMKTLKEMRELSVNILLESAPGVKRKAEE